MMLVSICPCKRYREECRISKPVPCMSFFKQAEEEASSACDLFRQQIRSVILIHSRGEGALILLEIDPLNLRVMREDEEERGCL